MRKKMIFAALMTVALVTTPALAGKKQKQKQGGVAQANTANVVVKSTNINGNSNVANAQNFNVGINKNIGNTNKGGWAW